MAEKNGMDERLNALFAEARQARSADASADLVARVLADAEALQPQFSVAMDKPGSRSFWTSLMENLGGWQGASGLVAATMASVLIGFSSAEALTVESLQTVFSGDADYYISDLGAAFNFEEE